MMMVALEHVTCEMFCFWTFVMKNVPSNWIIILRALAGWQVVEMYFDVVDAKYHI